MNLAVDLEFLGMSREKILSIAPCNDLPLDTAARVLGSMYVLEGSTLGGRMLLRHIRSRFDLKEAGCAFLSAYRERTGAMWKQFGRILENWPPHCRSEIVHPPSRPSNPWSDGWEFRKHDSCSRCDRGCS